MKLCSVLLASVFLLQGWHDASAQELKGSQTETNLLRLQLSNAIATDEAVVALRSIGSFEVTYNDSEQLFILNNAVPYIFSLKGNQCLVINVLPMQVAGYSVPIGIKIPEIGGRNLDLKVVGMDGFDTELDVFLEDTYTGEEIDLRTSEEYQFNCDPGFFNDRLVLHFNDDVSTANGKRQDIKEESVTAFYVNNKLIISENLLEQKKGEKVKIELYSARGCLVLRKEYSISGRHIIPLKMERGFYIARVYVTPIQIYVLKVMIF